MTRASRAVGIASRVRPGRFTPAVPVVVGVVLGLVVLPAAFLVAWARMSRVVPLAFLDAVEFFVPVAAGVSALALVAMGWFMFLGWRAGARVRRVRPGRLVFASFGSLDAEHLLDVRGVVRSKTPGSW